MLIVIHQHRHALIYTVAVAVAVDVDVDTLFQHLLIKCFTSGESENSLLHLKPITSLQAYEITRLRDYGATSFMIPSIWIVIYNDRRSILVGCGS